MLSILPTRLNAFSLNVFMQLSVVTPTYNEASHIANHIRQVIAAVEEETRDFEIVVVDDSNDHTPQAIRDAFATDARVRCIQRAPAERTGLATAIRRGIDEARGDSVLLMDSDGNHSPSYIPLMLSAHRHYDIVSGSRYIWGGNMMGSRLRYWGSYVLNLIIRFVLHLKTRDSLSGFVVFRRSLLDGLNKDRAFQGFGEFYISMLAHFQKKNASLLEIPVIYQLRLGDASKMKLVPYFFTYIKRIFSIFFRGA